MTTETKGAPARRYRNAIAAQGGACNALAVANGLVEAIREVRAEGGTERLDPACRLIGHQLAFLLNLWELDHDQTAYQRAMTACEAAK